MSSNYTTAAKDQNGHTLQCIAIGTTQNRTFTGTTAQSSAVGATTNIVRVVATQNCWIKFGASPTATTSDIYLPSGVVEYFKITPGHKIAAIQDSTGGTLNIGEGAI